MLKRLADSARKLNTESRRLARDFIFSGRDVQTASAAGSVLVEEEENPVLSADRPEDSGTPKTANVDLLDLGILLVRHRLIIVRVFLLFIVVGTLVILLLPPYYTAQTKFLPPEREQSVANSMLGQLGQLAAIVPGNIGIKNPTDVYVTMLKSRTVADALIDKFNLRRVYGKKYLVDARLKLEDMTNVTPGKDTVITISVDDRDPVRAAALANAYIDELRKLNQSEVSRRREFFAKELVNAKDQLAEAEIALKSTEETTGVIQLDAQSKAMIEGLATLRARIIARQAELSQLRAYYTDQNRRVIALEHELGSLRSQLASLKNSDTAPPGQPKEEITTAKLPALGLQYIRRFRDVKYYETVYEILAKQYEIAKLDEARESPMVVIDPAVKPEKRSKPKRLLLISVLFLVSIVCAGLAAVGEEIADRMRQDPRRNRKLRLMASLLTNRP